MQDHSFELSFSTLNLKQNETIERTKKLKKFPKKKNYTVQLFKKNKKHKLKILKKKKKYNKNNN